MLSWKLTVGRSPYPEIMRGSDETELIVVVASAGYQADLEAMWRIWAGGVALPCPGVAPVLRGKYY
jgi:hypothetical protein